MCRIESSRLSLLKWHSLSLWPKPLQCFWVRLEHMCRQPLPSWWRLLCNSPRAVTICENLRKVCLPKQDARWDGMILCLWYGLKCPETWWICLEAFMESKEPVENSSMNMNYTVPFLVLFIDSWDLVVWHRFTFLLRENCWAQPRPGSPGLPACPFAPTFPVFPIFPRCPGVPWRPAGPTTEAPAGPAGPCGPAGPSGPWGPTAPPGPYMPATIKAGRPAGPANKVTFCCGTTDAWQLQMLGKHLQTKWRNYIQTVRKGCSRNTYCVWTGL